jgi:hypothetical protein
MRQNDNVSGAYTYTEIQMTLRKRVEVLFDPEKFTYLEQAAREQNTSVGHLIREAVAMYLVPTMEKRHEAAQWLTTQEFDFGADWEELKEELAESRYPQARDILDPLEPPDARLPQ